MTGTPPLRTYDDWKRWDARRKKEQRQHGPLTSRELRIQQINSDRIMSLSAQRQAEKKAADDRAFKELLQPGVEWLTDKAKGRPSAERFGLDAYRDHYFNPN